MRHRIAGRRLGRDTKHRKALRRNLITELYKHERIRTTTAKAKSVKADAEKLITLARNRGDAESLIILAEDGDEEALRRRLTDGQATRLLRMVEENDVDGLEREARSIARRARPPHRVRMISSRSIAIVNARLTAASANSSRREFHVTNQ